jgi:glucose/arabinose dehydrogenase
MCCCLVFVQVAQALPRLAVPAGFEIEEIASVPGARSLSWGDEGTLFVSTQFSGRIYALTNVLSGNPEVFTLAEGLKISNGVAFRGGDLYIAEATRITVLRDIESRLASPGEPELIIDNLPAEKLHSWKYLSFGPDDKLYVSVGAPCNICEVTDSGLIARLNPDGSEYEVFVSGVRNSVGFDWHPDTNIMWFTDNGRDMLGDDIPPDELNQAAVQGAHFGFPFCHGLGLADPDPALAELGDCADTQLPAQALGAHVAALGLSFYTGTAFPAEYRQQIFIAEHGSWNRSEKSVYRVSLVRLDKSGRKVTAYEPFVTGWLEGNKGYGRPVDVIMAPDGSLLVSDDKRGVIYRISYAGNQ